MSDSKVEGLEYAITLVETFAAGARASGRPHADVREETAHEIVSALKGCLQARMLLPPREDWGGRALNHAQDVLRERGFVVAEINVSADPKMHAIRLSIRLVKGAVPEPMLLELAREIHDRAALPMTIGVVCEADPTVRTTSKEEP